MNENTTYVGMDVHKRQITVCALRGHDKYEWQLANTAQARKRMVHKLKKLAKGSLISCCYEAGPCGYTILRELESIEGFRCMAAAPSLIPIKPGERIKTDRRDAEKLAYHLRARLLTAVHPPTPEEEAIRDLSRAREAAMVDRKRHRHQVQKFLDRRGIRYPKRSTRWGKAHMQWLRGLRLDMDIEQQVFNSYLAALEEANHRHDMLVAQLTHVAESPTYSKRVGWLRCFRGIDTLSAMILLSELHDFRRFETPRELAAYLGLIPREWTSDQKRRQGGITRAGNGHVRRILVEAAHHAYQRPNVAKTLRKRREGQPEAVISIANKAMHRLYKRFHHLAYRGKHRNKIVVALARELVGFIWAVMYQRPLLEEAGVT